MEDSKRALRDVVGQRVRNIVYQTLEVRVWSSKCDGKPIWLLHGHNDLIFILKESLWILENWTQEPRRQAQKTLQ